MPPPVDEERGHDGDLQLSRPAQRLLVRLGVATRLQRRAEVVGVQAQFPCDVGQDLYFPDVALLDEERPEDSLRVALADTALLGIGEAFEGEPTVGLRGYSRQHYRDAQALGHRVNHLLPGRLQVVALGSQRRRGIWSQLERSPGDLHVTALDRIRDRSLS